MMNPYIKIVATHYAIPELQRTLATTTMVEVELDASLPVTTLPMQALTLSAAISSERAALAQLEVSAHFATKKARES